MKLEDVDTGTTKLKQQLNQAGIDTSSWGTGNAKTLEHLQKEIDDGETILALDENNELMRTVIVGGADVYFDRNDGSRLRLKEDRQVFTDGRERRRDFPAAVNEKMKVGEDPLEAMVRGIEEELGVAGDISIEETGTFEKMVESPSYPGLKSKYIHHQFRVVLSEEQFNPEGYVEEQSDKSTFFVWEEV